jgi:hypothetical protein
MISKMNHDNCVEMMLDVRSNNIQPSPGVHCHITIKNISGMDVVLFKDASLPTVVHEPPDRANILYGLTKMPDYAFFEAPERLKWTVLKPKESRINNMNACYTCGATV